MAVVVALLAATFALLGPTAAHAAEGDPVTVSGNVIDAGTQAGIGGADVEAMSDESEDSTTTAENGGYTLNLPPGSYSLYASADGYEESYLDVEITDETTTLPTIELTPLPDRITVTGSVSDASTGSGIPNASLTASSDNDYGDATTDEDGDYTLDIRPGSYDIYAYADGYEDGYLQVDITDETTTLPTIELTPVPPGIYVTVQNETFGGIAANTQVSLQPQGGGDATVLTTDEDGQAVFTGLASGQYTVQVIPGDGYVASGDPQVVDYSAGDFVDVSLLLSVDLSCKPASAATGLTNMGFEQGLTDWTLGYQAESIQAVGADDFASPWEGSEMARIGQSEPSSQETQTEGPNVMCQDFVVDQATEKFAFDVFTYDYTGFDEFNFDVVVSDPDTGETLASYQQGAWGEGTDLKTSGWRGVSLDLSDHIGDTVRLSFRSGGTSDDLYAFWVYLDSAEQSMPAPVQLSAVDVQSGTGSVTTDPTTGQLTVAMPSGAKSDLTLNVPASCQDDDPADEVPAPAPTAVSVVLDGSLFPAELGAGDKYTVTIPADQITSGTLSVQVECAGQTTVVSPIGQIVLYDPSGDVTDAKTGQPIAGAEVSLYKVPGWTPQGETGPYPADSCQTNLSKPAGAAWSQAAPTDLGELVNAASPEISPNVNPFLTNSAGYFGWDVAEGCWYVVVSAEGYETLTSPVVGVPTAVTDLDLKLQPTAPPPPPAISSVTAPAISGTPKVGQTLTATGGTWNPSDVTLNYQWLYANGDPVAGATTATHVLTTADQGKSLKVKVTATKTGYTTASAESTTLGPIGAADPLPISNATAPAISGTPKVGQTLTATGGTWNPSDVTLSYQWLYANGDPVAGATTATHVLTTADQGKSLKVKVTATKTGYTTASAESTTLGPIGAADPLPISNATAPVISGTPKVGQTLTATGGTWNPSEVTLSYQWLYANGDPVAGATTATHVLTTADQGKSLKVKVTATKTGYTTATAESTTFGPIEPAPKTGPSTPSATGKSAACSAAQTGLATSAAKVAQAQKQLKQAKAKLKKAQKSHSRAKVKKAKKKVTAVKKTLAAAIKAKAAAQAKAGTACR